MRIGLSTLPYFFPFHDRNTKSFSKFRKWGYDTVELAIAAPSDLNPAYVREQLDRQGLAAGAIGGLFGPGRDLRGKPAEQEAAISYIKALLDQMPLLGCSVLAGPMYSSVGRAGVEGEAAKRQQWKLVTRHLRELAAYAGDRGCTLCVQPLNRFETDFLNTCEQAIDLACDVDHPALRIHLDTFHLDIEGKDPAEEIRRVHSLLGHFHASGSDRGALGCDHTNWHRISSALRIVNYPGDVVVMARPSPKASAAPDSSLWRAPGPTHETIARKGAGFLRRVLNPDVGCELFPRDDIWSGVRQSATFSRRRT